MRSTAEVLEHHEKCFATGSGGDIDRYSADAVFFGAEGALRGPGAIRSDAAAYTKVLGNTIVQSTRAFQTLESVEPTMKWSPAMTIAALDFVISGSVYSRTWKTNQVHRKSRYDLLMKAIMPFLFFGATAGSGLAVAEGEMPALKAERWVNSTPLVPEALRGKVVLIDFWEYTCINWMRTSPYVKAWNRDYARFGLVVVGVHAPEFEFGKRAENIDRGIRDHGLTYPIAIDNDFLIWQAFENDAWPAKYLFDAQGQFVNRWVGEGSYDEIESEIRRLLIAAKPGTELPQVSPEAKAFAKTGMPSYAGITGESYVGARRRERGMFKLEGGWRSDGQFVELQTGTGKIVLPFTAGEVNLVVQPGSSGKSAMTVLLDEKPIGAARGADVGADGVARFDRSGMIRLVAGAPRKKHVLTLIASDPGVRAYVFTFGP